MSDGPRETRAREWIAALAAIPARFAGSISEHTAAERVGEWMRQLGVEETTMEAVVSRPRTGWAIALHAAVALAGLWWGGFLGMLLTFLAALSFRREFSGGPLLLSNLLSSPPSVNVVGRVGPPTAARRVILSAHIDTAQAGWIFSPRLADLFSRGAGGGRVRDTPPPGPLALPRALFYAAAVVALAGWLGAYGIVFGLVKLLIFAGLLIIAVVTLQWANAPATPGANDNASAVASMLTCAEALLASKPDDVELWLVGTGAEEVGCCGMRGFVGRRLDWRPDSTFYLNFECTGGGGLHYVRSEGVLGKSSYPPLLLDLARSAAESGTHGEITPADLLAATDGHVAADHGYPTLSLISLEDNGVPRHYHRPDDTVDGIDLSVVVRAADFGAAVARDALAVPRSSPAR